MTYLIEGYTQRDLARRAGPSHVASAPTRGAALALLCELLGDERHDALSDLAHAGELDAGPAGPFARVRCAPAA